MGRPPKSSDGEVVTGGVLPASGMGVRSTYPWAWSCVTDACVCWQAHPEGFKMTKRERKEVRENTQLPPPSFPCLPHTVWPDS